jgi:hypothetical protein
MPERLESGSDYRRRQAEHRSTLKERAPVEHAVHELVDHRVLDRPCLVPPVRLEASATFPIHAPSSSVSVAEYRVVEHLS